MFCVAKGIETPNGTKRKRVEAKIAGNKKPKEQASNRMLQAFGNMTDTKLRLTKESIPIVS